MNAPVDPARGSALDPMRALHTPRLRLEPLVAAHAPEMFRVLADPAIYEFENHPPASEQALAARYARLQTRRSPDGRQAWLNWVIRLPSGEAAGYVQATALPDGTALIAYELNSTHWRQGVAFEAVGAVLQELRTQHAVRLCLAVLKARNHRSMGLLRKLGFTAAPPALSARFADAADEAVMARSLSDADNRA